jgi:hypothetical protein
MEMSSTYPFRKLKPASVIAALGPAVVVLAVLAVIWTMWGVSAAHTFIGLVFLFFAGLSLANAALTRNPGYIIVALFQICAAFSFAGKHSALFFIGHRATKTATGLLVFFLAATFYLWFTKRLKWRIREILELAAAPVTETTNGFTPRPRPLGKAEYSTFEMREFAAFALKHHLAVPYFESGRVVLVPADWTDGFMRLYRLRRDYSDATWVAFDDGGSVSVHIAQRDYLLYKDDFSFDQLCQSLGGLFVEFLDLFKRGEGTRIIDRMNAVREHPAG